MKYHVVIEAGPDDCMALMVKDYCFDTSEEAENYYQKVLRSTDTYFEDIYEMLDPFSNQFDSDNDLEQEEDQEDKDEGLEREPVHMGYTISLVESSIDLLENKQLKTDLGEVFEYREWFNEYGLHYGKIFGNLVNIYYQLGAMIKNQKDGDLYV